MRQLALEANASISQTYEELKKIKRQLLELKKMEKALVDEVRAYMGESKILYGREGAGLLAEISEYIVEEFDKKQFKSDDPRTYNYYANSVVKTRLLIK